MHMRLAPSVSMEQLARATGGVYFRDSGDLVVKEFRGSLADGREYYALAYVPKNSAHDGKYRTITVEIGDRETERARETWAIGRKAPPSNRAWHSPPPCGHAPQRKSQAEFTIVI